jgi:hypothetical protein
MNNVSTPVDAADRLGVLLIKLAPILDQHRVPLATLRLAAYTTDAMRVLRQFEQQANLSQAFDDMLKSACCDWRNPGSIDDPADLIAVALMHVSMTLRSLFADLEMVLAEASVSSQS